MIRLEKKLQCNINREAVNISLSSDKIDKYILHMKNITFQLTSNDRTN